MKMKKCTQKDPCKRHFFAQNSVLEDLRYYVWDVRGEKNRIDVFRSQILGKPAFGAGFVMGNRGIAAWYFGVN